MDELEERLCRGIRSLNGDQIYVVAALVDGLTEQQIADELSASRGRPVSRNRVHRVKLTAMAKLRRAVSDCVAL